MLLVKTYLDKSAIHGLGVFADDSSQGRQSLAIRARLSTAPGRRANSPSCRSRRATSIQWHGYRVDGEILLTADHDHHMNHSDRANTRWHNGHIVATRDIAKGDEITNDYRILDCAFCAAFLKKKTRSKQNGHQLNGNHRAARLGNPSRSKFGNRPSLSAFPCQEGALRRPSWALDAELTLADRDPDSHHHLAGAVLALGTLGPSRSRRGAG